MCLYAYTCVCVCPAHHTYTLTEAGMHIKTHIYTLAKPGQYIELLY